MNRAVLALIGVACLAGCASSGNGGADAVGEVAADVAAEATPEVAAEIVPEVPDEVASEGIPETVEVVEPFPPRKLPFEYTRPAEGDPLTPAEVTTFTKKVAGLWKKVDWWRWALRTSQGVDASTGRDDFLAWYNDTRVVKAGDTMTFKAEGGEHNMWIPGSKVLSAAINGYLLTGDWTMGKLAEQYCKGLTAVVKGFIWDENDPAPFLMARSIFPMDHTFTLDAATWKDDGRKKGVEYHDMYQVQDGWNARTFAWPHNPAWGAEYVTNMRSKDDVCAIVRTTGFLPYAVADAKDDFVRTACQETLDTMKAFNKDIVDSGYNIRTKGVDGVAYVVTDQDLGSYVQYSGFDDRNECSARLASDLIAYGQRKTNDCGSGFGSSYDGFACATHYYNYPIVWNYHMAAVLNSLVYRQHADAANLLDGLAQRIDSYLHPSSDEQGAKDPGWGSDMAVLLVQAASVGLPLKAAEARHVEQYWTQAIADYQDWPRWDLWDVSVPDGEYTGGGGFRPSSTPGGIQVEALTLLVEYCNSPFRNPAGAAFVDCDVLKDIASWGQE